MMVALDAAILIATLAIVQLAANGRHKTSGIRDVI